MRTAATWAAACACVLGLAGGAGAQTPDPDFAPTGAEQYLEGRSRGLDQATHPEFQALSAPITAQLLDDPDALTLDPYRAGWACTAPGTPAGCRGSSRAVEIRNRYGARLHGRLYGPPAPSGRAPAVIVLPGNFAAESAMHAYSHDLAEAGYVVLGLEVQTGGRSDTRPPDPDPTTPQNELCEPGDWQRPQELGLRERGECAGMPEDAPAPDPARFAAAVLGRSRDALLEQDDDHSASSQGPYDRAAAVQVFGALDAVRWLRSGANPWRRRIDAGRVGILGHSLGSIGALLAGNGDPLRRFRAVVSLDTEVPMRAPDGVEPTAPTMFHQQELGLAAPRHHAPSTRSPAYADLERFRAAGVPSMLIVPDASLHLDFAFLNYVPLWALASTGFPTAALELNASRHGERVSVHYARAWFDRWLTRGASRRRATGRLLAERFDESADSSSIGQGRWVPRVGNVPYEIGGDRTRERLSPLFPSPVALGEATCPDLREGCSP